MQVEPETLAAAIGLRLREARKAAGLTLNQVAQRSDMSQSFLSQVENGRTMASVLALHRIAAAVGTTAHHLLEEPETEACPTSVIRSGEGRTYVLSPGAELRFCVPGGRAVDVNEVTAGPHSFAESATQHVGQEGVYVVEGSIRFEVDAETYQLGAGDTLYYSSAKPHRWFNTTDSVARFLFVSSPSGL